MKEVVTLTILGIPAEGDLTAILEGGGGLILLKEGKWFGVRVCLSSSSSWVI